MSEEQATEQQTPKRPRKLIKRINDSVVETEVLGASGDTIRCDFSELPDEIQEKLGPFGLSHKLGDSAAGKEGDEAHEAITKVIEGLMSGDFSVRAPAEKKISESQVKSAFEKLSPAEQEQARQLMASLGMSV